MYPKYLSFLPQMIMHVDQYMFLNSVDPQDGKFGDHHVKTHNTMHLQLQGKRIDSYLHQVISLYLN